MRIFKALEFNKWSVKEKLSENALRDTVNEMNKGLIDANLGGNIYKKRIALHNDGKRGGARTILAYLSGKKAFFLYGFAKNAKANVTKTELKALKKYGNLLLNYNDAEISNALEAKVLVEIKNNG
jgi:hypothetical protein